MKRIHIHWTAGSHKASAIDKKHYHYLIEGSGKVVSGDHNPEVNESTSDGLYVAHTRRANTGAIGVAVCAMAGAKHTPFNHGRYPITEKQMNALVDTVADLCDTYGIEVERDTVLTHAEIQPTLGIAQRGKWDITWLPGMDAPGQPISVGDGIRRRVKTAILPQQPLDYVPAPPAQEVPPKRSFWSLFTSLWRTRT